MNDGDIYKGPAAASPSASVPPQVANKPATITVFGILHLLTAVYGLIMGAWTLFLAAYGNPFLKYAPEGPERDMQAGMMEAMEPMNWVNGSIMLILMVLLVIAGVKLLRGARNAVVYSNVYAVVSLIGKVAGGILMFIYMIPAQREMFGQLERQMESSGGMPASMKTTMEAATTFGAVIGVLVSCAYPVLALILLNRRPVKDWLARFGK